MLMSRRAGLAFVVGISCAVLSAPVLATPPVSAPGGYAIGGFDVVAYYTKKAAVRGKPEFKYVWHDATWLFENAENRDKFAANADAYAPQYGGHCAWKMIGGGKFPADPKVWSIRDGKLYLFGNQSVNKKFNDDGDTYIAKANSQWQSLYAR
jgi:YHS domain-containing protein